MFVLFVIQDLEVEAEQVDRDGVFPGVVLLAACEEGLSEEESRHPEHSGRPLIVPVLKTQQVTEDRGRAGLIHRIKTTCKNARMNNKNKKWAATTMNTAKTNMLMSLTARQNHSLCSLKRFAFFFSGSQAVQPRTPANRQTGRPERFTLIDADSELITSVQEELVV